MKKIIKKTNTEVREYDTTNYPLETNKDGYYTICRIHLTKNKDDIGIIKVPKGTPTYNYGGKGVVASYYRSGKTTSKEYECYYFKPDTKNCYPSTPDGLINVEEILQQEKIKEKSKAELKKKLTTIAIIAAIVIAVLYLNNKK